MQHVIFIFQPPQQQTKGNMSTYKIVMVRHGESAWNAENRFCGWFDADLADSGVAEAKKAAEVRDGDVDKISSRVTHGPNSAHPQ